MTWSRTTFEGMTDFEVMMLLVTVGRDTDGDPSDEQFMEAIRRELVQRHRVRQGLTRTWG